LEGKSSNKIAWAGLPHGKQESRPTLKEEFQLVCHLGNMETRAALKKERKRFSWSATWETWNQINPEERGSA